jgi:hypothetical protein
VGYLDSIDNMRTWGGANNPLNPVAIVQTQRPINKMKLLFDDDECGGEAISDDHIEG